MTAVDILDLFKSAEYQQDLKDLSSYLASIAPETPMRHCLAKRLWERKHQFQLEAKRSDLVVGKTRIEFKATYDFGIERLEKLLAKRGDKSFDNIWDEQRKTGWNIMLRVYEDICKKKPLTDIFVWIICSRDLSKVPIEDRNRLCMSAQQLAYNKRHPYADRDYYLKVADGFLEVLQTYRRFSVLKEDIVTNGDFPSTYHLWLCDFASK